MIFGVATTDNLAFPPHGQTDKAQEAQTGKHLNEGCSSCLLYI